MKMLLLLLVGSLVAGCATTPDTRTPEERAEALRNFNAAFGNFNQAVNPPTNFQPINQPRNTQTRCYQYGQVVNCDSNSY